MSAADQPICEWCRKEHLSEFACKPYVDFVVSGSTTPEGRRMKKKTRLDEREEARTQVVDCVANLFKTILECGGEPGNVLDMTLREFIVRMAAQNGIEFSHRPTRLKREAKTESKRLANELLASEAAKAPMVCAVHHEILKTLPCPKCSDSTGDAQLDDLLRDVADGDEDAQGELAERY